MKTYDDLEVERTCTKVERGLCRGNVHETRENQRHGCDCEGNWANKCLLVHG